MKAQRSVLKKRLVHVTGGEGGTRRGLIVSAYEVGEVVDAWWRLDLPRRAAVLLPGNPGVWVRCRVAALELGHEGLVVEPIGQTADFPASFVVFRADLVRPVA